MDTTELRRSTRARKPVDYYGGEQAKDSSPSRKRKGPNDEDGFSSISRKRITSKKPAQDEDRDKHDRHVKKAKTVRNSSKSKMKSNVIATEPPQPNPVTTAKPTQPQSHASDRHWHASASERRIAATKSKIKPLRPGAAEARLRDTVHHPPESYYRALFKADRQRMFVIDRERSVEENCHAHHSDCPAETVQIAGSTGNVYTVTISHLPSCTCPVGIFTRKGGELLCKHALYVLHHVLKAPDHLKMQNAFLTSELREIFASAPALPSDAVQDLDMDGNRKPVEGECPICCMEFEDGEEIVWCKAACGNNLHKSCFDRWALCKGRVTCPYCRSHWQYPAGHSAKACVISVKIPAIAGASGYHNVRDQLNYGSD